jgi:hypothetical protein
MNDTTPKNVSSFSAWLPLTSLALSAAAFSLGAPAALARCIRPSVPLNFVSQLESSVREEPVMFPMQAPVRLARVNAPVFLRR